MPASTKPVNQMNKKLYSDGYIQHIQTLFPGLMLLCTHGGAKEKRSAQLSCLVNIVNTDCTQQGSCPGQQYDKLPQRLCGSGTDAVSSNVLSLHDEALTNL